MSHCVNSRCSIFSDPRPHREYSVVFKTLRLYILSLIAKKFFEIFQNVIFIFEGISILHSFL
ncbi:hypothetical protein F383_19082 [Gossypium arboreum]|uniref:Uncharacterized protein n=1 Tax=Gossypium arboreum TaxID=29729 RepID=A0A0B0MC18_GOSAR|nr:hypothetical protein F383_19082 [Gossypium arboreum]